MDIDVDHVAKLARLHLSSKERDRLKSQMARIFETINRLKEVEVEGVRPFTHPGDVRNVVRPDEARTSLGVDEALKNAPDRADGHFVVPRVLEE